MGNFVRTLSDCATVIAAEGLWLEDAAFQQLKTTSQLPGMKRVVGLPDLHPGRGYPVGASFFSEGRFYPALVGNDIGCGMALWQTDIVHSKVKLDKLDKQIGNLDSPIDDAEWALLELQDASWSKRLLDLENALKDAGLSLSHMASLGTIGGGNHFMEVQAIDSVEDAATLSATPLKTKNLQVLVHSGSRGLGQVILRSHVDAFSHGGLEANTEAAQAYLAQHDAACLYAAVNRAAVAARVFQRVRCDAAPVLDVHHNTVTKASFGNVTGWLHRKGATPSDLGLVMLPGSRDDYSYLLKPVESNGGISLNSLAHGAGRKWQRADCKGRLYKLATPDQLSRTSFGGRVICQDKALIYEEAPQAYKSVDSVLGSLVGSGLVEVVSRSKPVLTYKTRGECC